MPPKKKGNVDENASGNKITSAKNDGSHGFIYEAKIAMLFALRAYHDSCSFRMWPNVAGVGALDDLVFECDQDGRKEYRLIQAKHKGSDHKNIIEEQLFSDGSGGDYNLKKYFFSYRDAKKTLSVEGSIKDVILCTNINFDESVKRKIVEEVTDEDKILNARNNVTDVVGSNIKQFTLYRCREEVATNLDQLMNKKFPETLLANRLVTCFLNGNPMKHTQDPFKHHQKELLAKEVIDVGLGRFNDNFINGVGLTDNAEILREAVSKNLEEQSKGKLSLQDVNKAIEQKKKIFRNKPVGLNLSTEFGVKNDEIQTQEKISMDEIKDYLKHLLFAVDQSDKDLDEVIKTEMGKEVDTDMVEQTFSMLFKRMLDWSRGKEEDGFFNNEKLEKFFEPMKREMRFEVKDPDWSFVGRNEELEEMHKKLQAESQRMLLTGLGGVGKSELARKYISIHRKDYGNRTIWINAESNATLEKAFQTLAQDHLEISLKNVDGKEKDIKSIVEDVYRYFSIGKSLFVFDNAEKLRTETAGDEGIDKFLPSSDENGKKPYVLITSRNQKWGIIPTLSLNVFTKDEAKELIKKFLGTENDTDIMELAKILQYFPLALQQAVAYIKIRNEDSKNVGLEFKITDYLDEYEDCAEELLDFPFPEDNRNLYTKTTFITWEITTEYIKKKKNGAIALEILDIISYLESENIHTQIFKPLVNNDIKQLGSSITLLKQYSMVGSGDDPAVLSVHRLVQQVIRIKLTKLEKEGECLRRTLSLFNGDIDKSNVDHFISAWSYADKYAELVREFRSLPIETIDHLIESVRYARAESFGENLLKVFKNELQANAVEIPTLMNSLGFALHSQGKFTKAISYYKMVEKEYKGIYPHFYNNLGLTLQKQHKYTEALAAYKKALRTGTGHLIAINNIATVLIDLGRYDEALEKFSRVLERKIQTFGHDHLSTLNTQNSIAIVLERQKKYSEALQMYQTVYEKRKEKLGFNHPDTLCSRFNMVLIMQSSGDHESALKILYKINEARNQMIPDHPRTLKTKIAICISLLALRNHHETLNILLECDVKCKEKPELLDSFEKENSRPPKWIGESILFLAAGLGKIQYVTDMLDEQRNINVDVQCGEHGETPLHHAACNGHSEVVNLLLNKGADINAVINNSGKTSLHMAAQQGHTEVVRTLLKDRGAHVNLKDSKGFTPLYCAAQNGHSEVVDLLLSKGADINAVTTEFRQTPLCVAAYQGHTEVVRTLLKDRRADVNFKDSHGRTSSFYAAQNGHSEVIDLLLNKGADINAVFDDSRHTLLHIAAQFGRTEVVRILLRDRRANVNSKDITDYMPLYYAAKNGNSEVVDLLLINGADIIAAPTVSGQTPLHISAIEGHTEVVRMIADALLNKGADLNAVTTTDGMTSLHFAACFGHLEALYILLNKGADIDLKDRLGWTALHWAANKGHLEVINALLNEGGTCVIPSAKIRDMANLTSRMFTTMVKSNMSEDEKFEELKQFIEKDAIICATNKDGLTILQYAVKNNYKKIVNFLLEKGADATIVTKQKGNTLLHFVALKGFNEIAEILLEHVSPDKLSAFVNSKTIGKGTTALRVARDNNHEKMVEILLKYGAHDDT